MLWRAEKLTWQLQMTKYFFLPDVFDENNNRTFWKGQKKSVHSSHCILVWMELKIIKNCIKLFHWHNQTFPFLTRTNIHVTTLMSFSSSMSWSRSPDEDFRWISFLKTLLTSSRKKCGFFFFRISLSMS